MYSARDRRPTPQPEATSSSDDTSCFDRSQSYRRNATVDSLSFLRSSVKSCRSEEGSRSLSKSLDKWGRSSLNPYDGGRTSCSRIRRSLTDSPPLPLSCARNCSVLRLRICDTVTSRIVPRSTEVRVRQSHRGRKSWITVRQSDGRFSSQDGVVPSVIVVVMWMGRVLNGAGLCGAEEDKFG